jgi:hypothetical protein
MMKFLVFVAIFSNVALLASAIQVGDVLCRATDEYDCLAMSAYLDNSCVYQTDKCIFDRSITCPAETLKALTPEVETLKTKCLAKISEPNSICSEQCRDAAASITVTFLEAQGLSEERIMEAMQAGNATGSDRLTKNIIACMGAFLGEVPDEITALSIEEWAAYATFEGYLDIDCGPYTEDEIEDAIGSFSPLTFSVPTIFVIAISFIFF